MVEVQGRAQESQAQVVSQAFSSEMAQKIEHVPDTPKTVGSRIEGDSAGAGESYAGDRGDKGRKRRSEEPEEKCEHPFKGKMLDIRGS
ncbi:MAG TPA: hypothetical protein GX510_08010 [Firmicutes bacterium]|nr:hypothetical protein [Candidatus Fermentithermobacillaceae bacterium]